EMLGNWSFGDYYKREAIEWAWELLTEVWKIPKEKLYATIYKDDSEAGELWASHTDIDPSRILKFGDKEYFWEMGDIGPCGPCSEIHIDKGPDFCNMKDVKSHKCGVNGDCDRFIELWNLVFIQYNRKSDGSLEDLPSKHVDTGAGFERLVAVLQDCDSNYDTDIFMPLLTAISKLSGVEYVAGPEGMPHRVIGDHIRALVFSIGDGLYPSNEGRGYVLRRLLRRAQIFGRKIGLNKPFLYSLVRELTETMGYIFPEISLNREIIENVIKSEEERFLKTLDNGMILFEEFLEKIKKSSKEKGGVRLIPGIDLFKLYDTFGFPIEVTTDLAEENGFGIDRAGFDKAMEEQKERG
ncbi:MAG: alanine--tRNA ligase, partial [Actinomycetia bacterium]|nr:alanine--tRNA ligase [Actinomycetes bacterium]